MGTPYVHVLPVSSTAEAGESRTLTVTTDDILVMVITGSIHHEDRLATILGTWGRWLPHDRLVLISDTEDSDLGTYAAPNTHGGHGSSQKKWYHGILHVRKKLLAGDSAAWVCVVDDDTFIFVDNLLRLLNSLDPEDSAYYGGMCSPTECNGPCVCGGGGWVAPRKVFIDLAGALDFYGTWPPPSCAEMYYSDQILSQVMNEMGNITFVHRKEFNAYPPDFYYDAGHLQNVEPHMKPDPILWWAGVVTFHYVGTGIHGLSKGISMRLLYDLVNSLKH